VTNIGAAAATLALRFRAKNICWPETLQRSGYFLYESEAPAANVLSVRKRSDSNNVLTVRKRSGSNKAPSRNGNQPHVMVMSYYLQKGEHAFIGYIDEQPVAMLRFTLSEMEKQLTN